MQKISACVTRDRAHCAKNSTFDYFDGTNTRENELDHSLLMTMQPHYWKTYTKTVSYPDYGSWYNVGCYHLYLYTRVKREKVRNAFIQSFLVWLSHCDIIQLWPVVCQTRSNFD